MNTFKLSQRSVHQDSRSSIENIHDEYLSKIQQKYSTYDSKQAELEELKLKLEDLTIKKEYSKLVKLKDAIRDLEKEMRDISNQTELTDYLCKAIPFIEEIENNSTNLARESDTGILKYVKIDGITNKGTKYKDYLQTCFNVPNEQNSNFLNYCKECKSQNRIIDTREAIITCSDCGVCEKHADNNQIDWSRTDSTEFIQVFTYKRKNHFKEWLTQLQAKESTVIPPDILELIYGELKKDRITNTNDITSVKIRQYLKKLRLNKYYEHIPNIIKCITNQKGLSINDEIEAKLMSMFDTIQAPFAKHCPSNRKNFLSYSFTLHKFCQLLNRNDLLIYFPLLKSREKLFEQEKIWKNICKEIEWKYISTI